MAKEDIVENEEEFISLDDDEEDESLESGEFEESEKPDLETPEANNKILYILIAVFTFLAFSMLGFLLYLYLDKQGADEEGTKTEEIIQNIQSKKTPVIKTESYEALIKKAQKLYAEGKKDEALSIHDNLSRYNRALSFYNVGVAALKSTKYDKAIEAFSQSQEIDKLRFESLLNIAIAAFGKGDSKTFETYLTLATEELSAKMNSPLYSYYRTLIDYYRGFYAEALVPLRYQTSLYYQKEQNRLLAKLYTAFDNHKEAINVIEKMDREEDFFTLGLLYANQEEYTLAEKYLLKATEAKSKPLAENLALALVHNKMGLFKKSAALINNTYQNYNEKAATLYPIKVTLKPALFDPVEAQKEFQKNLFFNDRNKFSLIFYFAPYRLMNPKQTIQNIHQGAKNIYVNAFNPALNNLELSGQISDANIEITKGVKAALNENLYAAKAIFHEGIKKYPSSAELHYNLALTYAKMYNFQKAHKHFKRSTVLDATHYLSPLFSHFCAQLLYLENDKGVLTKIENKVHDNADSEDKENVLSLITIAREDITAGDLTLDKTPFQDILVIILSQLRQDYGLYKSSTDSLLKKIPENLIANILHLDAHHDKSEIKEYSKEIQSTLTKPSLNFTPLYSGHAFVKEFYIQMLNIAGIVPQAKKMIENKLREKGADDIATLQTLAYADIYVKEFDQAYAIYNNLIDEHKQQDSNTLFLASIASIGALHHENAIALLELAKLTNESNLESRFALGILYHEAQNLEGAAIQYNKIGDGGFQSRYFSFNLDKSHLK